MFVGSRITTAAVADSAATTTIALFFQDQLVVDVELAGCPIAIPHVPERRYEVEDERGRVEVCDEKRFAVRVVLEDHIDKKRREHPEQHNDAQQDQPERPSLGLRLHRGHHGEVCYW